MEKSNIFETMKEIRTFEPTPDEFSNFEKYIQYIYANGGAEDGGALIKPPTTWNPNNREMLRTFNTKITTIKQIVTQQTRKDCYLVESFFDNSYNLVDYQKLAETERKRHEQSSSSTSSSSFATDFTDSIDDTKKFWNNLSSNRSLRLYGAGIEGTLIDPTLELWNLNKLDGYFRKINPISGVTNSWLYFGMIDTIFCWHLDDYYGLNAISYLHMGANKNWFIVPAKYKANFEALTENCYPKFAKKCKYFLRNREILIHPAVLMAQGIEVKRATQKTGYFMVTFHDAYHAGYNSGFNIAEETNFTSREWLKSFVNYQQCEGHANCTLVHNYPNIHLDLLDLLQYYFPGATIDEVRRYCKEKCDD